MSDRGAGNSSGGRGGRRGRGGRGARRGGHHTGSHHGNRSPRIGRSNRRAPPAASTIATGASVSKGQNSATAAAVVAQQQPASGRYDARSTLLELKNSKLTFPNVLKLAHRYVDGGMGSDEVKANRIKERSATMMKEIVKSSLEDSDLAVTGASLCAELVKDGIGRKELLSELQARFQRNNDPGPPPFPLLVFMAALFDRDAKLECGQLAPLAKHIINGIEYHQRTPMAQWESGHFAFLEQILFFMGKAWGNNPEHTQFVDDCYASVRQIVLSHTVDEAVRYQALHMLEAKAIWSH